MKVCPACNATYEDDKVFCPKDGGKLVDSGSAASNSRIGQVLDGRYRLVRMLGEGGMGEVYEAAHVYIDKKVAIKLLRPEITSSSEAVKRFYQEARSASSIGHENIIEIEDFGKLDDGTIYLAMEFLQGAALADIMLSGPLEPSRALSFMKQICEGLAAAHEKNIVHRDMKPENVFIIKDRKGAEVVKILDFGIAKMTSTDGEGKGLTKTGTIFGTPHYMAPEQAMGNNLDHRADIYSIGVIMFELFTGSVPFKAESFMGILTQHITTPPPKPTSLNANLHPRIEQSILRAMAKDPNERFQTMIEFLQDLNQVGVELGIGEPVPISVSSPPPVAAQGQAYPTGYVPQPTGYAQPQPTGYAQPQPTGYAPAQPTGYVPQPTGMMTPPPQNTGNFQAPPNQTGTAFPQGPGYSTQPPGAYAPVPASPEASQTQTPFAGQSTRVKKRKKGNGLAIGLVVFLLLAAAGGGGYWWFFIKNKDEKKSDNKTEVANNDKKPGDSMEPDMKADSMEPDMKTDSMEPDMKADDSMEPDMKADDSMEPDMKADDSMEPDMKATDTPKFKNPVKIMVFTNIDSREPPPNVKIGEKTYPTPYTIIMEDNGSVEIELTRPGYKSIKKTIKGSGRSRVKIYMFKIKGRDPVVTPMDMKPPVMTPIMVRPPMPPMPVMSGMVEFD